MQFEPDLSGTDGPVVKFKLKPKKEKTRGEIIVAFKGSVKREGGTSPSRDGIILWLLFL